jgi:hypothetical protein
VHGRLSHRRYNERDYYDVTANAVEVITPPSATKQGTSKGGNLDKDDLGDLDDHPF